MNNPVLVVTDGTTRIDILKTFRLVEWTPQIARPKGGGAWSESPFLQGRQLVLHKYANIIDTFELQAISENDKDGLIRNTQDLRRLLEKAISYWISDWQNEPVWIETRGICETNTRYAVIHSYRTPQDDNPFDDPYVSNSIFDEFVLTLEHGLWTDTEPGSGVDIEIGATETFDGRNLGNVDSSGVFTPTTADEVYIANRRNTPNLTDIYYYDASGPAFSANLMDAALPYSLLPAVPAVGDIIYFGVDTAVLANGMFSNLVFDIGTAQNDLTIVWERYTGVWASVVPLTDYTDAAGAMTGQPFDTTGVNSVVWLPVVGTTPVAINGITAFWIRARVTAIGGAPSAPTQQNRDVYAVMWPYIEIENDQLLGDINGNLKLTIQNVSGNPATLDIYDDIALIGARSDSRGSNFTAFINVSDVQNPANITVSMPPYTTNTGTSSCGRCARWAPGAAIVALTSYGTIDIDSPLAEEYIGTFRAFLRINIDRGGATTSNLISSQLKVFTGANSNIPIYTSDIVGSGAVGNVLQDDTDLGQFTIPDLRDYDLGKITFEFLFAHNVAQADEFWFMDFILIPTDEWVCDTDNLETTVGNQYRRINIDSISIPKKSIFSITDLVTTGEIETVNRIVSSGKATANNNTKVRLWFLMRGVAYLSAPEIESNYNIVDKITVQHQRNYLGFRGNR